MHPKVFREFERIVSALVPPERVLEIGAMPTADTLLALPCLAGVPERIGLNLEGPWATGGMVILAGDANDMSRFADDSFDLVLSNATLEHDRFFWRTLAEVRRVLRPGGHFVVGVPGYSAWAPVRRARAMLRRVPGAMRWAHSLVAGTITLNVHGRPGDYYRFSPDTVREVFLDGFEDVAVHTVLAAPRILGVGRLPG
jgi:SAM-dependent methyltransferase